jgi:hypothetical protein
MEEKIDKLNKIAALGEYKLYSPKKLRDKKNIYTLQK